MSQLAVVILSLICYHSGASALRQCDFLPEGCGAQPETTTTFVTTESPPITVTGNQSNPWMELSCASSRACIWTQDVSFGAKCADTDGNCHDVRGCDELIFLDIVGKMCDGHRLCVISASSHDLPEQCQEPGEKALRVRYKCTYNDMDKGKCFLESDPIRKRILPGGRAELKCKAGEGVIVNYAYYAKKSGERIQALREALEQCPRDSVGSCTVRYNPEDVPSRVEGVTDEGLFVAYKCDNQNASPVKDFLRVVDKTSPYYHKI